MSRLFKKSVLTLAFVFVGLSIFMSCLQPPQANVNSEDVPNVTENTSKQTAEDVEKYWTDERMRNAKPMPFPEAVVPEDGQATVPKERRPADTPPENAPVRTPGKCSSE